MIVISCSATLRAEDPSSAAKGQYFEQHIRPLLVEKCQLCHGPDDQNGNLRLDSLATILGGGDSGPAVIAGQPEQSLLYRAVNYSDKNLQMPPDGKLSYDEIVAIKQWIADGAVWPGADPNDVKVTARKEFAITAEDRAWWAFQPIKNPTPPTGSQPTAGAIDAFIAEKLAAKSLTPNPPADKRALVRRVTFDLTGLPPTPEEVEAFVADNAPDAYAKLIDRLLASPHYGEHWGRYWLDAVRFAQSNGYEYDAEKVESWRYRDYVIRAFNEDKPYDKFLREQLAGDEIYESAVRSSPESAANPPANWFDPLIATGFYRLGLWDFEPDDGRMAEFDDLDDVVTTAAQSMLGLTINCARCHDHKFDPISQADYYKFLAFFRNIRRLDGVAYGPPAHVRESAAQTPLAALERTTQWFNQKEYAHAQLTAGIEAAKVDEVRNRMVNARRGVEIDPGPFEWALVVKEHGPNVNPTHILARGNVATPLGEVKPGYPEVLSSDLPTIPAPPPKATTTGRRSVLADWIASPQNPLTARVMVNRIWQHHFGRGIVETSNDFGRTGLPPTHPELLDWLASEFIRSGWSVKHVHKLIMTSGTYQQSSSTANEAALAADEANQLWWRQNLRRLRAESLRDSLLAVSGNLNRKVGGPSIYPTLPQEVLLTSTDPGRGWGKSSEEEQRRRSVYIFVKRSLLVPLMETFDYTNTTFSMGERPTTTVAPQALMMLNNPFIREQATALAERVRREAGDAVDAQVAQLFRIVLQRLPNDDERQIALKVLTDQQQSQLSLLAQQSGTRDPQADAVTAQQSAQRSLCLMMLNLNEFIYVD